MGVLHAFFGFLFLVLEQPSKLSVFVPGFIGSQICFHACILKLGTRGCRRLETLLTCPTIFFQWQVSTIFSVSTVSSISAKTVFMKTRLEADNWSKPVSDAQIG